MLILKFDSISPMFIINDFTLQIIILYGHHCKSSLYGPKNRIKLNVILIFKHLESHTVHFIHHYVIYLWNLHNLCKLKII